MLLSIKHGAVLRKYVNFGIEKQLRNKNNASCAPIVVRHSVISFRLSILAFRTVLMASGSIGDPRRVSSCFSSNFILH